VLDANILAAYCVAQRLRRYCNFDLDKRFTTGLSLLAELTRNTATADGSVRRGEQQLNAASSTNSKGEPMRTPSFNFRKFGIVTIASLALLFTSIATRAQNSADELKITPSAGDHAAALAATKVYQHAHPANTPIGQELRAREIATKKASAKGSNGGHQDGGILRYPGDLTYQGGAVVDFTVSHAVYMLPGGSCPIAVCWGDPEGYLRDLGKSDFIHLADQYIGLFGGNRYSVGFHAKVSYTPPSVPLTDNDILSVVHAVASASGETGYGHIYHVFLPPGQDECFDSSFTECYSPDNFATFFYCAYHSSVDFSDIGHVLYSVEPYQNTVGCDVGPGTPNGMLIDSTDNVLNHETFETITDPDGTAWINSTSNALYGEEIADECAFVKFVGDNAYFDPPIFKVNGHPYAVQSMYTNDVHACGTAP
jgi:hypothetical protein